LLSLATIAKTIDFIARNALSDDISVIHEIQIFESGYKSGASFYVSLLRY